MQALRRRRRVIGSSLLPTLLIPHHGGVMLSSRCPRGHCAYDQHRVLDMVGLLHGWQIPRFSGPATVAIDSIRGCLMTAPILSSPCRAKPKREGSS